MTKEIIIPIAFICDENYVMPTGVAITSLIANKHPETVYEVHVFGTEISKASSNKLSDMSTENVNIIIHDIENKYKNINEYKHEYVTSASNIKFDISNFLTNYNKILYIDSDTLITNDLTDLYSTNIEAAYAGVVEDMYATKVKNEHKNFNVDKFFNAGVLLLNAQKIRNENMLEKLIETKLRINDPYIDNASFVVTFNNNVKYLSPIYNYMNPCCDFINKDYYDFYHDASFKDTSLALLPPKDLAIIHFTAEKPWNNACCFYWDEWIKYFKQSPFKKQKLRAKRFKFFRRERGKHLTLITILGMKFRIIK